MDQSTHEVRLANWRQLVDKCQARPEGQSAKQWLAENHISEKQYYYWLRKIRNQAFADRSSALPAAVPQHPAEVSFVEIPAEALASPVPEKKHAITI